MFLNPQQFAIEAWDQGIPPRRSQEPATIIVRVIRNKNEPNFNNLPSALELNQTSEVGATVYIVQARDNDQMEPFNTLR